jgi:outer membrane biosynthesis protein TonB
VKVKVDKTILASVALHVLVLGWVMLSFSTKALEMPPEDSVPVDVISDSQLAKVMAGTKTGKKENPKPLVEKVAEAKPVDDAVGKISEKPPVITETAPKPQPKVEEKPVEKKPDPPKVVEKKEEPPKEEPKPVEKKPEPVKPDPIAEALKKEEKKPPPPKPVQAAKPPEQKRIVERHFDQSQIAALLDKRDPTRQAATGQAMNSNAALGLAKGTAADNSATWGSMFQRQVERCWKKPYGGIESQRPEVAFAIRLKRDGTLEGNPVPEGVPATPFLKVYQESAYRAIIECQPYKLPEAMYEEWKYFAPVFKEKNV